MAGVGGEDNIRDFMEVTEATRKEALEYLNATNNSLERAVEMFFSGGLQNPQYDSAMQWNEADFNQDRSGTYTDATTTPAFQINAEDDPYGSSYNNFANPTRPPSRASQKSADSAMAMVPSTGRSSRMDFDRDQESGVVGNSHPYFGPATKPHYETSQWALTLAGPTVSENVPEVEVTRRKRIDGEPVFLKPLSSGDYLPSLITILCSIPAIRNAFLLDLGSDKSVGYDTNWWSGASIQETGAVVVDADPKGKMQFDLLQETQRLTAFLDATQRAYGSVDALARLEALGPEQIRDLDLNVDTELVFQSFLIAWDHAASQSLFRSSIEHLEVRCIDAKVSPQSTSKTLYDVLDGMIFAEDSEDGDGHFPSFKSLAQTFILKVQQENRYLKGLDIELPNTLYLDRYVKDQLHVTKPFRQEMAKYKNFIGSLEAQEEKMLSYGHSKSGKRYNPLKLVEKAMQAFRKPTDLEKEAFEEEGIPEDEKSAKVLEQLQAIHNRIQTGLQNLQTQKQNALKALEDASSFFKSPSKNPDLSPRSTYMLRGVATQSNITYVYRNRIREGFAVDPENTAQETLADEHEAGEWWRLEYTHSSSAPSIEREKVSIERIHSALNEEGRTALLVYASVDAIRPELSPLPEHLMEFVGKDNAAFQEELDCVEIAGTWDNSAGYIGDENVNWSATKAPEPRPPRFKPYDWSAIPGGKTEPEDYPGGKTRKQDMEDVKEATGGTDGNPRAFEKADWNAEADQLMDDIVESIEADGAHHIEDRVNGSANGDSKFD